MANYVLSELKYPGATSTSVNGINDAGSIVGSYTTSLGTNGFIYQNGLYSPIIFPTASATVLIDINDRDQFVGNYTDVAGTHGFLNSSGLYSSIVRSGGLTSIVTGLNDAGQISLDDAIYTNGSFAPVRTSEPWGPHALSINDRGDVVGYSSTPIWPQAYINISSTAPYAFGPPESSVGVYATDVNNFGEIVGYYTPRYVMNEIGIISDRDGLQYFRYPGADRTTINGINDDRTIIGAYTDTTGSHAFVGDISTHLNAVYRFYNVVTQDHFFTVGSAERDAVLQTQPNYRYEGIAFATPDKGTATTDVFRFYDTANKGHFYTTSNVERDGVIRTQPNYVFEGVAFQAYVSPQEAGAGAATLERFYNTTTGQHHYTAGAGEIQAINQGGAGPGWIDEGKSFTVHSVTDALLLF